MKTTRKTKMMEIFRGEVRDEIIRQGCEKCGGEIKGDCILSFYRGKFFVIHEECVDFLENAQKGQRLSNHGE